MKDSGVMRIYRNLYYSPERYPLHILSVENFLLSLVWITLMLDIWCWFLLYVRFKLRHQNDVRDIIITVCIYFSFCLQSQNLNIFNVLMYQFGSTIHFILFFRQNKDFFFGFSRLFELFIENSYINVLSNSNCSPNVLPILFAKV